MSSRFYYLPLTLLVCMSLIGCGGNRRHTVTVTQYTLSTLNVPVTDTSNFVYAVNDSGQSVGYVYTYGVVKWSPDGSVTKLTDPDGWQLYSIDDRLFINEAGDITGSGILRQGDVSVHGVVLWKADGDVKILRDTHYPDVCSLQVVGITDDTKVICVQMSRSTYANSIVIFNEDGSCTDGTPSSDLGTFSGANCNNFGLIVGQALVDGKWQAVSVDTTKKMLRVLPMLPGVDPATSSSNAIGVNNNGIIVGSCYDGVHSRWVMWDGLGNIHDLGLPPGFDSGLANSINDSNVVIGGAAKNGGDSAFVRLPDGRWINLGLFDGVSASHPYMINNQGQVAGISYPENGSGGRNSHAVLWTPVNP